MRKPVVKVMADNGNDLVPGWRSALVNVTFTDADGGDADEISITFAVSAPFPPAPPKGQRYRLSFGWEGEGLRDGGSFTYQSRSIDGDTEGGWQMTIRARSSDFIDADKTATSEHFEDTTAGEVFDKLAAQSGKTAIVDPDIAKIKIPYRLRHNQSLSGFADELANELGGTLKLANGSFIVAKRNGGRTAMGTDMPTIVIAFGKVIGGDLSTEEATPVKGSKGVYFDPDEGVSKQIDAESVGSGTIAPLHPARSKEEAEYVARAEADELARGSVSGTLELEGSAQAMAGAPVRLTDFGEDFDGLDLIATAINHTWTWDDGGGWLMSVEVGSRETDAKKKGRKKKSGGFEGYNPSEDVTRFREPVNTNAAAGS